jgi:glucosylceramidase
MTTYTHARHYLTARDTPDRLSQQPNILLQETLETDLPTVRLDPSKCFQTLEGFGGAFTEAAADTFYKMGPENRARILKAYFDRVEGHGYSLCRTHINSCDFSLGNYAYTEVDDDVELKHFSIKRDQQALLPLIKEARRIAGEPFKLFASPWSPPAWMKTSGKMNGDRTNDNPKDNQLIKKYWDTWAYYFTKYIKAYKKEGVEIWGITVQNEPDATQDWDSCRYDADDERDFVKILGPMLEKEGLSDVKIMVWDHNRDNIYNRAKVILSDIQAAKYVWGVAFHWYSPIDHFEELVKVHNDFPDKKLIFTEGCELCLGLDPKSGLWTMRDPKLDLWTIGERYGHDIIGDLNNWTVGWTDWNMLLDERGGPNHKDSFCYAPIIADTKNDRLLFQSSYYYLGHFSRFIRPGARRIFCKSTRNDIEATGFLNPDANSKSGATIAVVVMNRTNEERPFALRISERTLTSSLPSHSIATYVLE